MHVQQLLALGEIFDRPEYTRYARRWDRQQQSSIRRRSQSVYGAIEVNVNRVLTITGLTRVKYRRVPSLGE